MENSTPNPSTDSKSSSTPGEITQPKAKEWPLLSLVEEFQSKKDVHNVFGVLLYTERNPHVVKMLRDDDYWKALDVKSGSRWPIFSIRAIQGHTSLNPAPCPPGVMTLMRMIPTWNEPAQNEHLLDLFEIEDTEELPLLLIFMQGAKGEILRVSFKISGESQEECFECLRKAVDVVAGAIDKVTEENIKNTTQVFDLMRGALGQHILLTRIKRALSFAEWLKSLVSLSS